MSVRRSPRVQDIGALMATKNNNLAASAGREKGVVVRKGHAFFKVTIAGKVHVYNGNDGEDGIGYHEWCYSPSADNSDVPGAIRPLMDRPAKILQSGRGEGNCYMVAVALSRRYYADPSTFNDWAMHCTEEDCYHYVN